MTQNPIQAAKAATPWWMIEVLDYDDLEVHSVRDLFRDDDEEKGYRPFHQPDNSDETCCEICEPEEAHFWLVYGHCQEGGINCFEDFPTKAEAHAFSEKLLKAYPHLREDGISP